MEKGGPFIDVVCRTRYIGRDCRSIDHGVAFEGRTSSWPDSITILVLLRFREKFILFSKENLCNEDYDEKMNFCYNNQNDC